jgi:hypothetical protein
VTGTREACVLALAIVYAREGVAHAGGGAADDAYQGIDEDAAVDVHAFLDIYATRRLGAESQSDLQYRAFEVHAGPPALNLFRVTAAHEPGLFGFRVDAAFGDTANAYRDADPDSKDDPDLARALSYVAQAFVTVRIPVGNGLSIDAGKYNTPMGLEDNESWTCMNHSRSLLFTLAEPTYHSGLRATYEPAEGFAISTFWVNGWNTNVLDGNGMRSFAGAATWHPMKTLTLSAAFMAGPERTQVDPTRAGFRLRQLTGVNASWDPTSRITLATSFDYGLEAEHGTQAFWGVAGYGRVRMLPWLSLAARVETFVDGGGVATGTEQHVAEGTLTLDATTEWKPTTLSARLELRRDQSDQRVFLAAGDAPSLRQDTLTLAVTLRL